MSPTLVFVPLTHDGVNGWILNAFSPGIVFTPYYWLTRYPLELPPTWNLLGLFTEAIESQKSVFNLILDR